MELCFETVVSYEALKNGTTTLKGSSLLGLENTPTASLQRGKMPLTSLLDMIVNNLMMRF